MGDDPSDLAGRIALVMDMTVPEAVQEAGAELAAALAERAGMPVTLVAAPIRCLDAMRPLLAAAAETTTRELMPTRRAAPDAPMSSADFVWRDDGRPDWSAMWTSFCELALFGGPPHRGPDDPLRAPAAGDAACDADMVAEMRRGIWETTGLYAEPSEPGWLAVTCDSRMMAAWMCATIVLENVEARMEEDRLLVPAGPGYRLKDEVKSIITVVAKTHHYWQAHVVGEAGLAGGGA